MSRRIVANEPEEHSSEDGFRPAEISAWVAECRSRLRRITGGEERHRAGLMAEARMRQALDDGEPLDRTLAQVMEFYRDNQKTKVSTEAMASIERKLVTAAKVRDQLQAWASNDRTTGPCALENAACRSIRRLETLAANGWLPRPDYATQTAIHAWRATKKQSRNEK